MGKNAERRRQRRTMQQAGVAASWVATDGLHAFLPGAAPSAAQLEELTRANRDLVLAPRARLGHEPVGNRVEVSSRL